MGNAEYEFEVHPSIGVARVGDSTTEFYLAPESIGGRPIACDRQGNATLAGGVPVPVEHYKDARLRVKRQGARFRVVRYPKGDRSGPGVELTLDDPDVASLEWTVHVANKKAAWYNFAELLGDLYYSGSYDPTNSYAAKQVEPRNAGVTGSARQGLIIDPGPRTLTGSRARAEFSRSTVPADYPHASFPSYSGPGGRPSQGYPIDTLGEALTDDAGRLVVIGAYGRAGGDEPISSYAGANTWYDDIADGAITCRLTLKTGEVFDLRAWVIIGSPKFAPELVNVTTLDDILFDVGVRYHGLVPGLFDRSTGGWNPNYKASFEHDILPIIERMGGYQWVANVQSMTAASTLRFDPREAGEQNRANRESFFAQFRNPDAPQSLWASNRTPALPLNSGTNSVTNQLVVKFSTLTQAQYFLLGQWARGLFTCGADASPAGVNPLDRASVGNAVGEPMSPGIEVTWSLRNPTLYERPYRIKHRHDAAYYRTNGLDPAENETEPKDPASFEGLGCEPGDLTKRMAIPWQADFFQCTLQYVNFSNPAINKLNGIPLPPTYYAYWWPPQSPWNVIAGGDTAAAQAATGVPAGLQVNFARGINSFVDMITGWKYLGFIHNQADGQHRAWYPYFVEVERNDGRFAMASVAVGGIGNVLNATNVTFQAAWFLRDEFADDPATVLHAVAEATQHPAPVGVGVTPRQATAPVAAPAAPAAPADDDERPRRIVADPKLGLPRTGHVVR